VGLWGKYFDVESQKLKIQKFSFFCLLISVFQKLYEILQDFKLSIVRQYALKVIKRVSFVQKINFTQK
jgi:hypothetical protein